MFRVLGIYLCPLVELDRPGQTQIVNTCTPQSQELAKDREQNSSLKVLYIVFWFKWLVL